MKKYSYSLRWFFVVVTAICIAAWFWNYREDALKPDLSINAQDMAWATETKIWKIDLAEVGDCYGISVFSFSPGDKKRKYYGRTSGSEPTKPIDTSMMRVFTIAMTHSDDVAHMKTNCGMGTAFDIELDGILKPGRRAYASSQPLLDGDLIYLISDSQTVGGGRKPFDDDASVIGVEFFRTPQLD